MPWEEMSVVENREAFIRDWMSKQETFEALCKRHQVSRKTGYKWVQRFYDGGMPGLVDQSRRPHRVAHAVDESVAQAVVELRKQHPLWGPKKLRAYLMEKQPEERWPAVSTMGLILKERGLVGEQRRRFRTPKPTQPLSHATEPNVLWCTDFKGCFKVAGRYCHPLTITDAFSRYLLTVEAMEAEKFEPVQAAFERAFEEYGLPYRIRSDNGAPWVSAAVGGLSRLSVWWVKLGITPERTEPGHPEQNGRHERMHRTLKAEAVAPARVSLEAQQKAFDAFRKEFNEDRPHEALSQRTPGSCYVPSSRKYVKDPPDPDYPMEFQLRRIDRKGRLRLAQNELYIGQVLKDEVVGIEEIGEGNAQLWFGPIYLGLLQRRGKRQMELIRNMPK